MNNMVTFEQLTKSEHAIIGLMEVHEERRLQGEEDSKARQEQQFQALMQESSATNKRVHAVECRTIETRRQCEEGRREGRHPTLFQKEHHQAIEALKAEHAAKVAHLEKQLEAVAPAKKASYCESNLSQARPQSQVVSNLDKTALTPSLSPHKTSEDQEVNDRSSRQPVADAQCESTQASKVIAPEDLTNDATVDKSVSSYRDESGECKDIHEDADPALNSPPNRMFPRQAILSIRRALLLQRVLKPKRRPSPILSHHHSNHPPSQMHSLLPIDPKKKSSSRRIISAETHPPARHPMEKTHLVSHLPKRLIIQGKPLPR